MTLRPSSLSPLFASVASLPGVGVGTSLFLSQLEITRVLDLLWHLPSGILARQYVPHLGLSAPGQTVTLQVFVKDVQQKNPRAKGPQQVRLICVDAQGIPLHLVYFRLSAQQLEQIMSLRDTLLVSGKLERFQGIFQMVHPDHVGRVGDEEKWAGTEALYPLTKGLTHRRVQGLVKKALERTAFLPEWISKEVLGRYGWAPWHEALLKAHAPQTEAHLSPSDPCRMRLAYDELLAHQLSLLLMRRTQEEKPGRSLISQDLSLHDRFLGLLPFTCTGDQTRAMADIKAAMESDRAMVRLLQGDVGSGKTVVAFASLLQAVGAGAQGALMVPTEVLARQHAKTLLPWAAALGIKGACLTGSDKAKDRRPIYEGLKDGSLDFIIGTHALIQDEVVFKDLGLVIIDEQHRFGVEQRLKLVQKGKDPDVLSMTATPIPRTLMLASYGDLTSSTLREKPAEREPIDTSLISLERLDEVMDRIKSALVQGHKIYWVCPLIDESEALDLAAAEARFVALKERVGGESIGLVHGRMSAPERDAVMERFRAGEITLLVATTVIEVGVDVQDATLMIIEHAERFGLSQLHQLRGRVGRGHKRGTCLLLYAKDLSYTGRGRLDVMKKSQDGFEIAQKDLHLRGGGELAGAKQSGLPQFRLANPLLMMDLLELAQAQATSLLTTDPTLESDAGKTARVLLHLFSKVQATRYLSAA
jgi:ATP-dependent DNA helicase RecG